MHKLKCQSIYISAIVQHLNENLEAYHYYLEISSNNLCYYNSKIVMLFVKLSTSLSMSLNVKVKSF